VREARLKPEISRLPHKSFGVPSARHRTSVPTARRKTGQVFSLWGAFIQITVRTSAFAICDPGFPSARGGRSGRATA
jgi:hypothetical protein